MTRLLVDAISRLIRVSNILLVDINSNLGIGYSLLIRESNVVIFVLMIF